ncbi:lithostathine-like [Centroberyx affinis]|uniref:lithostathine-like n=1 Tax=Centroberyx affinis TaxID=166261 RepID=UPI003A5C301E
MEKVLPVLVMMMAVASAAPAPALLNSTGNARDFSPCPDRPDWFVLGDRCVKYFTDETDFTSAVLSCRRNNAYLISICDQETNEALHDFIVESTGQESKIWIGGFTVYCDPGWNKKYLYIDGEIPAWYNWYPNYPTQAGRCVLMNEHGAGKWSNGNCEENNPYVCAFKI